MYSMYKLNAIFQSIYSSNNFATSTYSKNIIDNTYIVSVS